MTRRGLALFLVLALSACGRPPLSESTLRVFLERRGDLITYLQVDVEQEGRPCGRLGGIATLNGRALSVFSDGSEPNFEGTEFLFRRQNGCAWPRFLLLERDEGLAGQPFELVVQVGEEHAVLRSEHFLTVGFRAGAPVPSGGMVRLSPSGDFVAGESAFEPPALVLSGGGIEQLRAWSRWDARWDGRDLVATVPLGVPPGTYAWSPNFVLRMTPPEPSCGGLRGCVASTSISVSGVLTVAP